MGRPKTAIVGIKLRMREPLRKKLEVAAKARGVSLNAEAVARLERTFEMEMVADVIRDVMAESNAEQAVQWQRRLEQLGKEIKK